MRARPGNPATTLHPEGASAAGSAAADAAVAHAAEQHRPHWKWKWTRARILGACALAVVLVAAAVWIHSRTSQHITYVTAPATQGSVIAYVVASGSVNPVVTVQVGTYVSGVIQQLYCDFNTEVKEGQLCAKIDPRPYQSLVDQDTAMLATARAQLVKDQANLAFSQTIYDRNRGLLERGIVSQETLDTSRNALEQARAQVALDEASVRQREAELNAAQVNLDYTNIVSPVDGTVVSRNVTQGQTVAASFQTPTLFIIATDLTKMQVDANVSEADIGAVKLSDQATFTVDAFPNRPFQGRVVQVRQSPQSIQNVVTYDVVSEAPNPDLLLKPGMTAAVRIYTDRRDNVLRVPVTALRYSPTAASKEQLKRQQASKSQHVWVLRDGAPVFVPVVTGLSDESNVEIVQGELKPADQVIVSEQSPASQGPAPTRPVPGGPRL